MKILQSIAVKQVLTEQTKMSLAEKYQTEINQLEKEVQQLQFQERKQTKNHHSTLAEIQTHFQKEVHNRLEKKKTLEFQLKQLHILPIGTEINDQEVMSILDVQVGDKWKQPNTCIIIKDGIVIEIR